MDVTYLRRQRHILLDMHVPDWDPAFMSTFDPDAFVERCAHAGADAVMVYCNSHTGLAYWPTKSGRQHGGLRGRDIVKAQVEALHERDIAVCAYYSGPVFNGWAYSEHPDWRLVPSSRGGMAGPGSRYGVVCPNNRACIGFMLEQVEELVSAYAFDAFFFDMVFWTSVCVCGSCRQRYRNEHGAEIPEVVDWLSAEWCRFQTARERWLADAFRRLRERVKTHLDVPVFLNGGIIKFDWWAGVGDELMSLGDLLGGDFHHQSVLPALAQRTPTVMQYMKAVSAYGGGASQLMSVAEQTGHALTATAFGGQFMAIDAVAPDGAVNPAVYDRLREVFAAMKPYEPFLGGKPVIDIGVYWSQQSAVNFADNGVGIDDLDARMAPKGRPSPHSRAVDGAVEALMEAHLPVGVLGRADLGRLSDFSVVVLPNVLRMDHVEVAAFRDFVANGGSLYASGETSLTTTDGSRHDDFLLADVFGCHWVGSGDTDVCYLKPATPEAASWIEPVSYVAHGESDVNQPGFGIPLTTVRIAAEPEGETLATITTPYGTGHGSRDDQGWASIHNSPPWTNSARPAIVRRSSNGGRVAYSAADIETADRQSATAAPQFFVRLVRSLLQREPRFDVEAHPDLWVTAFEEPDASRMRICLLNRPARFPALAITDVRIRLAPPPGTRFTGVERLAAAHAPLDHEVADDGSVTTTVDRVDDFVMLMAGFERLPGTSVA